MQGVLLKPEEVLCRSLGDTVQEIYRACYRYKGQMTDSDGDPTLLFSSGRLYRFHGCASGYGIEIHFDRLTDAWQPRARPMAHGDMGLQDECVDVPQMDAAAWNWLVGEALVAVDHLVHRPHGEIAGLSLQFEGGRKGYIHNLGDEVVAEQSIDMTVFCERPVCPCGWQ
jgi:hypothetical protein